MKIRRILLSLLVVAAVAITGNPARVGAAPYPPHNTATYERYGRCVVYFMHGNVYGAAYAKFFNWTDPDNGVECASNTEIQVTGYNGGFRPGNICRLSTCPINSGWRQSTAYNSFLFNTRLKLCSTNIAPSCQTFTYPGI